jgi:hypothetical protein
MVPLGLAELIKSLFSGAFRSIGHFILTIIAAGTARFTDSSQSRQ